MRKQFWKLKVCKTALYEWETLTIANPAKKWLESNEMLSVIVSNMMRDEFISFPLIHAMKKLVESKAKVIYIIYETFSKLNV